MICKKYARNTLSEILRHIRDVHPYFEGPLRCGVDNCPSTLRTYKSLCQHMYSKHKSQLKVTADIDTQLQVQESGVPANSALVTQNISSSEDDELMEVNTDMTNCNDPSPSFFSSDIQPLACEAGKFILKTLEGKKLTQIVADDIIVDTTTFVECALDHLKQRLKEKLGDKFEEVEAIFSDPAICSPFQGLKTRYHQEKFFQHNFNYVVRCEDY